MSYNIGMAVRRKDHEFRDSLQTLLDRKHSDILGILKEYGVPAFPVKEEKGRRRSVPRPSASAIGLDSRPEAVAAHSLSERTEFQHGQTPRNPRDRRHALCFYLEASRPGASGSVPPST